MNTKKARDLLRAYLVDNCDTIDQSDGTPGPNQPMSTLAVMDFYGDERKQLLEAWRTAIEWLPEWDRDLFERLEPAVMLAIVDEMAEQHHEALPDATSVSPSWVMAHRRWWMLQDNHDAERIASMVEDRIVERNACCFVCRKRLANTDATLPTLEAFVERGGDYCSLRCAKLDGVGAE